MSEVRSPAVAPIAQHAGPVRIAYVIGGLGKGGAEYQLYELVRRLDPARFAPTVVSLSTGGHWAAALEGAGVPLVQIPQRRRMEPGRLVRLRRHLRALRPQILHTVLWSGNSYGRLAAIGLGISVVVAAERNVIRRPKWQRLLERLLDPATTAYLTNTEAVVDELVRHGDLPAPKMHVVHNGIDLDRLPSFTVDRVEARRRLGFDPRRRLVAQVGRLEPQKDHPTFLAAMAEVAARHEDVDVLVVGEGGERGRLEALAERLGLASRTRFLGLRDDVPELLAAVDVMVLASRWEGLPNVVIEAMATGAATVATDVGGCRRLLRDGAGCLVEPGDVRAISEAVSALLGDDARRREIAGRARARVESELSIERTVAATTMLYERWLGEAGP